MRISSRHRYRGAMARYRPAALRRAADEIERDLAAMGTPQRAAQEKRYLKSELRFHGATLPQIDRTVRAWLAEHPDLGHDALVSLVDALWSRPVNERRMAAVMLLEHRQSLLAPGDLALLERLLREARTWAYLDALAANVVGPMARAPEAWPVLDRWAADSDFWLRRAALLSQLVSIRGGGSLDRFLDYADAMLDEREFFIRKAIGWVLRDAGKRRPAEVIAWLAPRTHRASGVTMREAVKHLPAAEAERLMAAYRQGRIAG